MGRDPVRAKAWAKEYHRLNRVKRTEYAKKWNAANSDWVKARFKVWSLKKYGITLDEYNQMLADQGGVCKLCSSDGRGRSFHVDHDHVTGKVRGILCWHCNTGLGKLGDTYESVARAADYLAPRVFEAGIGGGLI